MKQTISIATILLLAGAATGFAVGGAVESLSDMSHANPPERKEERTYLDAAAKKEQAGDFRGAIADYTTAIQFEPRSVPAHYDRARLYLAMARFKEAIADLDIVIKQERVDASNYLSRGDAHAGAGHASEALADYEAAIRNARNSTDGDRIQGHAWYEKGDFAKAAARFDQARRRGPRDDRALNAFAWFKATCPDAAFRNGREAIEAATKACEFTKWRDGDAIDTLAAAYAEIGDFEQAIKYQTQALSIRPLTAPDSLSEMQRHLRAYHAHKPYRHERRLQRSH